MGGKGIRRREKNFKKAHGGYSRLPPPPNPSNADPLPSKLRHLLSLTSLLHDGSLSLSLSLLNFDSVYLHKLTYSYLLLCCFSGSSKAPKSGEDKRKRRGGDTEKDPITSEATAEQMDEGGHDSGNEKKKKKRKKNEVNDRRFETLLNTKTSQKKRERRKKYLESKKNKHKQSKTEEDLDFPRHEQIQFGDVVQAPPKLLSLPKGIKKVPDASQERIRLQAINAYRKRKGWTSRLGLQLPSLNAASTS